jgi:hypothetical protein
LSTKVEEQLRLEKEVEQCQADIVLDSVNLMLARRQLERLKQDNDRNRVESEVPSRDKN